MPSSFLTAAGQLHITAGHTWGLPGSIPPLEPLHPDGKYRHPSTQATETQGFWGSDFQVWDCSAADPSTPQER